MQLGTNKNILDLFQGLEHDRDLDHGIVVNPILIHDLILGRVQNQHPDHVAIGVAETLDPDQALPIRQNVMVKTINVRSTI